MQQLLAYLSTHRFHPGDWDGTVVQQRHGEYKEQGKRSKVRDRAQHDGVDPNAETTTIGGRERKYSIHS